MVMPRMLGKIKKPLGGHGITYTAPSRAKEVPPNPFIHRVFSRDALFVLCQVPTSRMP